MRFRLRGSVVAVLGLLLLGLGVAAASASTAGGAGGTVYTLSNQAAGNAVLVFSRAHDGTLAPAGSFPTGGRGTGSGLGSQGALVLDESKRWLFAVDPGSNEISAFEVKADELKLVSHVPSGGVAPISLTVDRNLVYVLHAGDTAHAANIVGFRFRHLELQPLSGSSRSLSASSPGPAQIQFSPDGTSLVVTEKNTNSIDTFLVGKDGLATGPNVQPSAGTTPFGFDFDSRGHLIVSDAFGGTPGASALSSYAVAADGTLTAITPIAANGQTAACWVVTTRNGRYAYTTNTGSANISSYTVGNDGSISLLNAVAGPTGTSPIDASIARDKFLYTLDAGSRDISAFAIEDGGSLTPLPRVSGLPAGAVGLAAR